MKRILSVLPMAGLAIMVFFSSCSQDGCTDPTALNYDADADDDDGSCEFATGPGTLAFHLHPKVGDNVLNFSDTYTDDFGTNYQFTRVQFYLTDFVALAGSGNIAMEDDYLLVNEEVDMYPIGSLPSGEYSGLTLAIGVDGAVNNEDPTLWPAGHPLAPMSPSMHWSWANGYKFVVLEGKYDKDGSLDGSFVYHLGSNDLLRTVELEESFTINENAVTSMHMDVNVGAFLMGVDIKTTPNTHTMDNMVLAKAIADNAHMVFGGH